MVGWGRGGITGDKSLSPPGEVVGLVRGEVVDWGRGILLEPEEVLLNLCRLIPD